MEKESFSGKRKARKIALQALYQWHMSKAELSEIEAQFRSLHNMAKIDSEYFCRLLYGIPKHLKIIEDSLSPLLDRGIESLNPVELTVLRIGAFELLQCPEVPFKVVLNESISLSKEFGSKDGHRYVNGVLHHLAKTVRAFES